ncbi:secreted protein [Phakopsora pachyrhizi]|nr:secreted protein [Phakopsora pachyrhizi]
MSAETPKSNFKGLFSGLSQRKQKRSSKEIEKVKKGKVGEIQEAHGSIADSTQNLSTVSQESSSSAAASQPSEITNIIIEIEGEIPPSELDESISDSSALIPSVIFAIPLPPPFNANRAKSTTPFVLYTPPRSVYAKPPKKPDGKKGKEKLAKKLVRRYQEEVLMGEKLKRKEYPKSKKISRIQKIRGCCIRGASMITKWLPTCCVEILARIPPRRKIGEILVLHPSYSGEPRLQGLDQPYQPTPEELRHDIGVLLRRTRRRILGRIIAISAFMPIALGIDVFAPVFAAEISLAYLGFQIYGWKKVNALTSPPKKPKKPKKGSSRSKGKKALEETKNTQPKRAPEISSVGSQLHSPTNETMAATDLFRIATGNKEIFDPISKLLYDICSRIDPRVFPPTETVNEQEIVPLSVPHGVECSTTSPSKRTQIKPTLHKPGPDVVKELIKAFRENLPEDIANRHNLDPERVSEDLARYLKKAAIEYIGSLKGRPGRNPASIMAKWFRKRGIVHDEKKEKKKLKKQIKAEIAAETCSEQIPDQLQSSSGKVGWGKVKKVKATK